MRNKVFGIKGINTAGQSPAPAAYGGFPRQSRGVLNPSFPHSLDYARASTATISLRSSIINFELLPKLDPQK
jgi:hypothetical protein